jgi:hypothetical protein
MKEVKSPAFAAIYPKPLDALEGVEMAHTAISAARICMNEFWAL